MREIKFRAWDGKHMITASHNYYLSFSGKSISQITEPMAVDIKYFGSTDKLHYKDVSKYILMQYTGLKDKNGKEIYEGDLVEVKLYPHYVERISWKGPPDAVGEVFWDFNTFRFTIRNRFDKRYADMIDVNLDETNVIGNIYENPDIVK